MSMELYEDELKDAVKRIKASGREAGDFALDMKMFPPDPDGGGMFTIRYQVTISNVKTSKSYETIGGIGLSWVEDLEAVLNDGFFD